MDAAIVLFMNKTRGHSVDKIEEILYVIRKRNKPERRAGYREDD